MAFDVEALMGLWTNPLPSNDAEAAEAFRALYHDPVTVNGTPIAVPDLVARARVVQAAFETRDNEILDMLADAGKVAVAFRMKGRQVGPLPTSLGPLAPTGDHLELRVIDILTIEDERVSNIWMVADELGALVSAGAVTWSEQT
jgi:predicted ester cyclase